MVNQPIQTIIERRDISAGRGELATMTIESGTSGGAPANGPGKRRIVEGWRFFHICMQSLTSGRSSRYCAEISHSRLSTYRSIEPPGRQKSG
jgi:hypothetical protein